MRNLENDRQRGITLIALVVTIVVLIILATVSILAVFGDNGIIARAQTAKDTHEEGKADETNTLDDYASYIGNYLDGKGGSSGGDDTTKPVEPKQLLKSQMIGQVIMLLQLMEEMEQLCHFQVDSIMWEVIYQQD